MKKQIIFIDSSIENYPSLIEGAKKNAEIVILDKDQSGVEQITQALKNGSKIKALHIVSHGSPGRLQIGSDILTGENIHRFSNQLQQWGKALTKTADILVYGCEVAAGKIGEKLLQHLNQIIGANIAASSQKTGNATLGGNWKLDKTIGLIETPLAFSAQALKSYGGVLATKNFDFSSIFSDDVIINHNNSITDPSQTPFGDPTYALVTQSFATFKAGANGNGLPDNGFFAANSYHPDIQLGYSNTNDSNNAKILTTNNSSFTFNVTPSPYQKIHLFATGTQGSGTIDIKFNYSDGTNSTSSATIPDIATSITESASSYYLINGLDLSNDTKGTSYWDFNAGKIFGLGLTPNTTKTLQSITVTRTSGANANTWLDFFGATGEYNNSAPILNAANVSNLTTINEDPNSNPGTLVSTFLSSGFTDANSDPSGIAVTGLSNTSNGTWQFSKDNGSNWTTFGAVTDSSATLLSKTVLVRFVPNANFNGNVSLTYRGWDSSSGSNGQTGVNVSTNGGTTAFSTATATSNLSITNVNDAPTGTVNITGTATQNQTLTATNTLADADGLGTLNYQWQESSDNGVTWTNISGATNNTFTLSQAQVGKKVQVKVSYTDLLGTVETVNSTPTNTVTNVNDLPTGTVNITGTATQNQTLTATNTLADADGLGTFNYQWQESSDNGVTWSNISGATNNTFTLSQTQVGKKVQVKVSYTDLLGTVETVNSIPTNTVTNINDSPTGNVSITGTATQNQTLTATNTLADADGLGTLNYQWQESSDNGVTWTNISGATNNTFTLSQTQVGKKVQVKVSYTDLLGTAETVNSIPTNTVTNINDSPTGNVSITGTATQNQTLTATNTLADVDGLGTLNYQWQESSDNGVTWTNISGATNNTFTLSQAQVGKKVQVKVSYTDLLGTVETVNSIPTNTVTNINDSPTGNVSITGTATQNQTLTATNTLADADGLGTLNYQWQESSDNGVTWTNISGATNNTFTLSQTQVGKKVQVKVSYTDGLGTAETVNSSPTSVVSGLLNNAPTGNVSITGTATQNQILTATNTLADVDGLGTFNYQWQESSDNGVTWTNISGATNNTFTLSQTQVGKKVQVKVNYTDLLGTVETVKSTPTNTVTNVNDLPTGTVNITGTATQNQTLTATNTLADADGLGTLNYQWQESSDNGVTWTNISGATNKTFTLSQAQVGKKVQVKVSYTDLLGTVETVNSSPTSVVTAVNHAPVLDNTNFTYSLTTINEDNSNSSGDAVGNIIPAPSIKENTNVSLTGVLWSSVTTADFDKDGDTDILLTGQDSSRNPISKIYSNNGSGGFSQNTNVSLSGVSYSSVTTADFDKDGNTDILLTGWDSSRNPISKIYSNNGSGGFSQNTNVSLPGVLWSSVTTADFDKDGNTDILLTGWNGSKPISKIYSNNGSGGFSENTNVSLTGVLWSSVTTADFDKDGDTDILLTGDVGSYKPISKIYSNNGSGGFSENTNVSLTGVRYSSVTTADFDKDGDTDILLTGDVGSYELISKIYSNNGSGGFSENTNVSLTGVYKSSVTTADFDKDGNTDILLTGSDSSKRISKIYSNNGSGGFSENANVSLSGVESGSVTTADFDKDGDTDILLTGYDSSWNRISKIYNNLLPISDVDTTTITEAIAITAADKNGTWQYSTDNGTTWTNFPAVSNSNALLLDGGNKVRFQPDADYNGTITKALSFRAWDKSTGTVGSTADTRINGGTTAFSVNTATASITVTAFNNAPTATDKTLTVQEDNPCTFTTADFGFSDVDTGNTLASIKITQLPTVGTLQLNGNAVTANQVITAADISNLVFTPVANANGSSYANFKFTVNDGTIDSVAANTITIDVTAVNDAPTGNVSITGTATQNQILTATNTLADADGLGTLNYQWQQSADNGVTWTDISGATNNTFTLSQTQVGKTVQVKVSYTDLLGTQETVKSSPTSVVSSLLNKAPTGTVNITGTPEQNQTLTATNTLADADGLGTFNYQWQQSADNGVTWTDISGATNNTFTLSQTQVGKKVQVKVSYTDLLGTAETVNSSPTSVVTVVNHAPVLDNTNFTYSLTTINKNNSNSSGDAVGNIIPAPSIKENTNFFLPGVGYSSVTTADFDKDGDTDILLTGMSYYKYISTICSNNGSGGFSQNLNISLPSVKYSSVTTADFDKNGYTDILLTGWDSYNNRISKIYSNNGSGGFSQNTNISLTGVSDSSVTTADFDKDGDTDILLTGMDSSFKGISKIYSNNGSGGFSENTNVSLSGVSYSSVTTADFDKDGDTDILLTGWNSYNNRISKIYSNNGSGGFSENTNVSLTGVSYSSVTTADFDKDGNTDILLTGKDNSNNHISKIYSNNGSGGFSENTNISLPRVEKSSVTTADFDKDGDTDILLTGRGSSGPISKIYSNNGSGGFSENTNVSLTGVYFSSVTTADFDKDGNTDILLTGKDISLNSISKIYSNFLPISDVDTTTITEAIAITAADKNGTWQYSTDNSTTWANFPTVSNSNALLLDAGNKVRFQPNANYNGTITNALTFRAWDKSTGTVGNTADTSINGGTTAFSSKTVTVPITVTAFNNAPTATDKTLTVQEDNPCTFTTADFGFSDVDTTDTLASIKITQLPTVGTLQLNGNAVTANQVITAADISNLVFTPVANANGSSYANFKFTVNDGTIDSVAANTITIDVTAVNDAPTGNVSITGTATQNQILTATNTLADADGLGTLNYQWQQSADNGVTWTDISGATNNTFTLSQTQVGKTVQVKVSYTDLLGTQETVKSSPTSVVSSLLNKAPTGTVNITGTPEQNQTLTATNTLADADGLGTFNYQWQQSVDNGVTWTDISGATNNTFTLSQTQVGKKVQVKVSYTDLLGTQETVNSSPTSVVSGLLNNAPTGNVSITGTATQNQILTATNTLADVDGLGTLNYQWQQSADNGVTWTNISGATNNTFALSQTQVGKTVQVKVSYTDLLGTAETVNSSPTSVVTAVNHAPVLDNTNVTYSLTTINEDNSNSSGDAVGNIITALSIKENTNVSLTGVYFSSVTTADFDKDGDTDILLTGMDSSNKPISKIYSNNGSGGFSENTNVSLTGVRYSSVTTADFDKDGDTDILLTGMDSSNKPISKIYSNNGSGGFSENTNVSLTGVRYSSVTTADFDKDGDTDILLTGRGSSGNLISKIYSNNGSGGFSENTNVSLTGVYFSSVTTADFDKDGDTDILLTGKDSSRNPISKIYSNNGSGGFSENTNISLTDVYTSSVTTADFDKDGDTDILLTSSGISTIYSNNGSGGFSENTNVSLTGVSSGSVTTADFDKDGDTDILLTGYDSSWNRISKIYSNNGSGGFSENANVSLTGVSSGSVTTADFDKDGDTDILLTSWDGSKPISKIYSNFLPIFDVDTSTITEAIAITAADKNGTWQYSTDNGTTWTNFPAVSNSNALLLDGGNKVRFQPDADYNGTITKALSFRAWDKSTGTVGSTADTRINGGTTAFSVNTATASITVTAFNNAPTATDKTLTVQEDNPCTFTTADFGFSDVDTGNTLASIKITQLPTVGTLQLNGKAVKANQVISAANIPNLKFTRVANANGSGYANFGFTVNDGQTDSLTANKITIDVTAVNDAPTGNVSITGTSAQNPILTATNTLADVEGLGTLNYQWQESADNGVTWTNISGATNNTFTLSQAQVGKKVQVKVSYTDGQGTTETVTSNPTNAVFLGDIIVTKDTDNGKGDTEGTLSWAIDLANKIPGADTIKLNTDVRLNFGSDVIRMWSLINSDMTVDGQGHTINGDNNNNGKADKNDRPIFFVYGGEPKHTDKGTNGILDVTFKNLTLKNAVAKGGDGGGSGGGAGMGGALFIYQGNVTVDGVTFEGNQAIGGSSIAVNTTIGTTTIPDNSFNGGIGLQDKANKDYFANKPGGFGSQGYLGASGLNAKNVLNSFSGGPGYDGGNGGFGGGGGYGGYGGWGLYDPQSGKGGRGGPGGNGGNGGFGGGGGAGGGGGSCVISKGSGAPTVFPGQNGYGGNGGYGGGNGSSGGGSGFLVGGGAGMGGAIFVRAGNLTIQSSSFKNNSATGGKGYNDRITTDDGKGLGGAIFALTQETIDAQKAINGQGLPTSPPTVTTSSNTTFENNVAVNATTNTQAASGTKLDTNAVFGNITVQDGPIAGATAFFDANLNGTQDSDEPSTTTDSAGNFTLDIPDSFDLNSDGFIDASEGEYVAIGGTDAITGQAFTGTLRAVPGSTVVTPLTTLISTLVDTGALPETSETQVKTALGLPSSINLATFDPIAAAQAGSSEGQAVLAAQVAVQTLISQISNSLQTVAGISSNSLDAQVTANLAQLLQTGSVNLSDSTAIQTLITNTVSDITNTLAEADPGNTINLETITNNTAQLSEVIAASNQQILTATTTDGIFQAQKVAQTSVTEDLTAALSGTKSFSEVVTNNTGEALTAQIATATIDTSIIDQPSTDPNNPDTGGTIIDNGNITPNQEVINSTGVSSTNQLNPTTPSTPTPTLTTTNPSSLSDPIEQFMAHKNLTSIPVSNPPDDLLLGDDRPNSLSGGVGQDTLLGYGDNDFLSGNKGQDVIYGFLGNDLIYGGSDDDWVGGGKDNDLIFAGLGNDTLSGDLGNDTVLGEAGNDLLVGNIGEDLLSGGTGNDNLYGGDDNDLIHGGQGEDLLDGSNGDDLVTGDLGNDTLNGGIGTDSLIGGQGADIFMLNPGENADIILDFVGGEDLLKLTQNYSFNQLTILQGTGTQAGNTLIQVAANNELLATLIGVPANSITANSFTFN